MSTVLYIHGFASAGSSGTAIVMRNLLYSHGVQVVSPDVPTSPLEAQKMLQELVGQLHPDLIVATSMGHAHSRSKAWDAGNSATSERTEPRTSR